MRFVAFILLLLASLAIAQDPIDTHGKTDAQILKMGMEKWSDFYTSKEGASTASMTEAAGIYGDVAKRSNDRLLKGLKDGKLRDKMVKLRALMSKFASSAVDVSYCESGGGTMYNTMWAAVAGVVEDALTAVITRSGPKVKPLVVSAVEKRIAKIGKDIEDMHRDSTNSEFFKYKDAKTALTAMKSNFAKIVEILKTMSRTDSDRILTFCLQEAKNTDAN